MNRRYRKTSFDFERKISALPAHFLERKKKKEELLNTKLNAERPTNLKRRNGIWRSPWMLVCSVTFEFEKKSETLVCWSLTVNAKFVLILLNQTSVTSGLFGLKSIVVVHRDKTTKTVQQVVDLTLCYNWVSFFDASCFDFMLIDYQHIFLVLLSACQSPVKHSELHETRYRYKVYLAEWSSRLWGIKFVFLF